MMAQGQDRPSEGSSVERSDERRRLEAAFLGELRRGKRRRTSRQVMLNVLGIISFLALWEVLPRIVPGINLLMFPPPSGVVGALVDLVSTGELFEHAAASVLRALGGFAIGSTAGIVLGVLTARLLPLRHFCDPVLHGLRSIPAIALVPLSIVWFGIGETPKLALISWGTFFPVWINAFLGARDVSEVLTRSAASLGAGRAMMLFEVVLPAALPLILAGLRQALAIALVVMVAAELVGASEGLGQLIASSYQLFRVDSMFVGLFTLGAIGFAMDRLFTAILGRVFPWYGRG